MSAIPLEALLPSPLEALSGGDLKEAVALAHRALEGALSRGVDRWVLTYSGGKDSTALAVLTLEWLKSKGYPGEAHLIYADTGLEIPTLHAHALSFLEALGRLHPPLRVHIARPRPEESFWVQVIGKGYPPPHNRFRWCTKRLKVAPMDGIVRGLGGKPVILTGVRFGESDARDARLHLSCSRGGECGQGVWFEESHRLGALYLAPIAFWRECQVWDFLNYVAPSWGYPTGGLEGVYGGRDTRFGCWACTVVRQEKALARIAATRDGERYRPLLEFRTWLLEFCARPENRVLRPNGVPGRLTLGARRAILERLEALQASTGLPLLSEEERALIGRYWRMPKYGNRYG
ncbi:phosphoadenosine phosphosulfate reductase family protein [Thermus oshimai]|uniref:phosphoadenosine phosphosulfate reductase domain-containing protein n=1 Tax=Thermus oshimai TaxID=56957 RepID=UPI000370319C|nr:phosphoadenosine phosphosulfate reductase family protein [Thermus oshimai]